jgi:hypothetical protein
VRYLAPVIFFLYACIPLRAQEEQKKLPRFSVRANVGVPKVVSSKAFRTSFLGLYEVNATVNVRLFSNFFIGVGYKNALFKAQSYFQQKNIYTNMQVHNGFMRVGYDRFYAEHSFATFAVNVGYNFNKYTRTSPKYDTLVHPYPTQYTGLFIQPEIGLYFLVEDNFAIGAHIAYNYNFTRFDPDLPYFDKWLDYTNISNRSNTSWITFGFGFYYGFVKKR